MNQPVFRNGKGQIVGGMYEWFNDENESYFDFKEDDVIFPRHDQDMNGEVTITYIKNK